MKLKVAPIKTRVTERGQTSIPSVIRREAQLKKGHGLQWEMVSNREFRVWVIAAEEKKNIRQALGYAKKNSQFKKMNSDQVLKYLRSAEKKV